MIGFGLGVYVDHKLRTNPWGSLGGLLLGVASGFYTLVIESLKGMRKAEREDERARNGSGENGE
jgi:F0F1-type ATP synthase assembly protein I